MNLQFLSLIFLTEKEYTVQLLYLIIMLKYIDTVTEKRVLKTLLCEICQPHKVLVMTMQNNVKGFI